MNEVNRTEDRTPPARTALTALASARMRGASEPVPQRSTPPTETAVDENRTRWAPPLRVGRQNPSD